MMSLRAISLMGLALLRTTTNAAPVSSAAATPGFQVWADPEFSGKFKHYTGIAFDQCYTFGADFPAGTPGGVSSIKADHLNECRIFPNTDCNPGSGNDNDALWVIGSYHDLGNPEVGWDDRAQSFKCTYCPMCNN